MSLNGPLIIRGASEVVKVTYSFMGNKENPLEAEPAAAQLFINDKAPAVK